MPREKLIRFLRLLGRISVRVVRVLLLLAIVALIPATWSAFWFERNILPDLPADISSVRTFRPPTVCRVYAGDSSVLDQFYVERRIWVPMSTLPNFVWQAFMAAEDRRFLAHKGVDVMGIGRALIRNLETGTVAQGGSTITQQLVKNLLVGRQRSYKRKLTEAVLALRLEKELSKRDILELYVNFVALGSGNFGVEAASQDYFGIPARDMNPGQAALLAGLVPAPSRYSPRVNPEVAAMRRGLVLDAMVECGFLKAVDAARYRSEPVLLHRESGETLAIGAAYATQVRREIRRIMGQDLPFKEGFQVYTPMVPSLQATAEAAVRHGVEALEEREGRQGALRHLEPDAWDAFLKRGPGLGRDVVSFAILPPQAGECFEALAGPGRLDDLRAGTWTFALDAPDRTLRVRSEKPGTPLASQVTPGDVLRVCRPPPEVNNAPKTLVRLDRRPWGEGAAIVVENATGRILALTGGYDSHLEGFVRATQARRQPGSSFKPYVYATALLGGRTQVSKVLDGPLSLPAGGGRYWSPKNFSGGYEGWLPLRLALAKSLNTVSVRLTLERGAAEVVRVARAMGIRTPLRNDPTIALGSSEVTPMDQAMGYSTIARLGVPVEPVLVDRVVDVFGQEVGTAGSPVRVKNQVLGQLPGAPGPRALPAGVAYELADMMREVVRSGTARRASRKGYDRAGKTGTTNGFEDAWFVGFTPRYTVAVWIGTDGTGSIGENETGGKVALPVWQEIVAALPESREERLPVPDDVLLTEAFGTWIGLPAQSVPPEVLATASPEDGAPLPYPSVRPSRPVAVRPAPPTVDEWLYGLPD